MGLGAAQGQPWGRGCPHSTLSHPRVPVTFVSSPQGLRPHVVQRVPSCAQPGEPHPQELVTVALVAPCPTPCHLCPFPPGCLFPALNQHLAGGLPKLRRRRQVSGDTGKERGTRTLDPRWPLSATHPRCSWAGWWVLGTHWQDTGLGMLRSAGDTAAHPQAHPDGSSSLCTPNTPGGSQAATRGVTALSLSLGGRILTLRSHPGPPSPAHGSQRDQVHRAGRGERPSAGKRGVLRVGWGSR